MALGKSIATAFGVAATYWKIANVIEDYIAAALKVTLAGYISAEARQAGSQPLAAVQVDITGDGYAADEARAAIYAKIKALPAWSDATDC